MIFLVAEQNRSRKIYFALIPYHPWDDCIFTYMYHTTIHVGKYTSPIDGMGMLVNGSVTFGLNIGIVDDGTGGPR